VARPFAALIHVSRTERVPVDPAKVYLIETAAGNSLIRLRGKVALEDLRPIGEISPFLGPHGFARIHREFAVNLNRIRRIRLQEYGRDWEVQMEPPVNRILPVARDAVSSLWSAFDD